MTPGSLPGPPSRKSHELSALLLLFLIAAGFFWKLVLTDQYTYLESNDLARQVLPWFQMQVGELQAGRLPFWDPYVLGGQPLIGQTQPGTAYPLNWVLFLLPTRHGWIKQSYLHWYFVMIHFIAMAGCYLLCRDLKLSRAASIFGGCMYGLGGYMNHIDWPQMLHPASLAPLVLLFTLRAATGRKPWGSAAAGGACLGMAFLGGHHQAPTYTALMASGVWIWAMFREKRLDRAMFVRFAAFVVVAGMTSGLQLLPAYEYSKNAYRWVGAEDPVGHSDKVPYHVHEQYSFNPLTIPGIVLPGMHEHTSAYVGFTGAAMALLGWMLCWPRRETRVMAFVAVGGLLYTLGGNLVFHGVLYSILPLVEKARNASMAVFVFNLGAASLAAMAVDALLFEPTSVWISRMKRGALWFALLIFVLVTLMRSSPGTIDSRSVVTALVAVLVAGLLQGRSSGALSSGAAAACLVSLLLVELSYGPSSYVPHRSNQARNTNLPRMARDAELVKALRALPQPARAELNNDEYPHSFGDFHGIDVFHGYLASLTRPFYDLHPHDEKTQELFGVRYKVAGNAQGGWNRLVYTSSRNWKIWENPDAFPAVFSVHQAQRIDSRQDIDRIYGSDHPNLRKETFLYTEPPQLETCDGDDELWLLRRESNLVRIAANLRCRGMVVLGDNHFPGWVATVDGAPAEIHGAYTALRGVVAEKGWHIIEMRYRPKSVYFGAVLTLMGWISVALAGWMDRARAVNKSKFFRERSEVQAALP